MSQTARDARPLGVDVSLFIQNYLYEQTGVGYQHLSGFENLTGSAFDDSLSGDGGVNVIKGAGGADSINGGAGDDTISNLGGGGQLLGNSGDDHIITSGSSQFLNGGAGADTYDFVALIAARAATLGGIDTGDTVALGSAAASYGLAQFTALDKFDGAAGEIVVRYHADGDRTLYKIDVDGDGKTDSRIIAKGGDYGFAQFTGVDTSHLTINAVHIDGGLVI